MLGLASFACDESPQATPPVPTVASVADSALRGSSSAAASGAAGLPPLHPQALDGAKLLLDKADAQQDRRVRMRMAAGILEQLEASRLPGQAVAALAAASERRVVTAQRATIVWEAIAKTPALLDAWNRACASGSFFDGGRLAVTLFAREKDPRKRATSIFSWCGLEHGGLMKLADLTFDYDLVMLAHTIGAYLSERGGAHDLERRALVLLAKGGAPPQPPIDAAELPELDKPKRLSESQEHALHQRIRGGVTLLKAGSTKKFFAELVHPHELGGIRVDDAVETFSRNGKTKPLLRALELAVDRPVRDDGEGEASVPLPWRPDPDARERLRFQLHEGVWFLRL